MITSIKHKGLRMLWVDECHRGVIASHRDRLEYILTVLDSVSDVSQIPSNLRCHKLNPIRGREHSDQQRYAVDVSGAWRVTFFFWDGNASVLNYEDYH